MRHSLMAAGVAVSAWLALFGDKTPNDKIAEPVLQTAAIKTGMTENIVNPTAPLPINGSTTSTHKPSIKPKPDPTILALRAREKLIGSAASASKSNGIFGNQNWEPPPPKPIPPPPPTAPALPFKFIGKKVEDAVWEVYLARGEISYIVREKSVIESIYRVDAIRPPTLTLTYLPLNQVQTLAIGGTD